MPTKSRTRKRARTDTAARRRILRIFSDRLGELKRAKHYTLKRFADEFDAKENTARDWLNRRVLPRTEALYAIADHFKVTIDWLLGVEGAPKYWNQSRSGSELADDLAVAVRRELSIACAPVPLQPYDGYPITAYRWQVSGSTLLRSLVERLAHGAGEVLAAERVRLAAGKNWILHIMAMNHDMGERPSPEKAAAAMSLFNEMSEFWALTSPSEDNHLALINSGVRLAREDGWTTPAALAALRTLNEEARVQGEPGFPDLERATTDIAWPDSGHLEAQEGRTSPN